jgi:hypothetical protein
MEDSLDEEDKQNNEQISIDCQGCITADTSKTSEYSSQYPSLLFTETEARDQKFCEPSFTSPQKGKDSLGRAHYHLDSKNSVERERSELSQTINVSCDRGQNGEGTTKHISDINIHSSNSLQRRGLILLSETLGLKNDTTSRNQERQLSAERHYPFSSPIPERISQGSSSCCISEPTRDDHSTNIVQGSNVGEAKILQYTYPKPLELHNKEGHSGISTISGRDGNSVNKIVVEHKALQNCESCNKTMLKSSYTSHLKSVGHKRKALSTDSNHQQLHQSNTNHIQPQQQHINSGIQSLIDADSVLAINFDVQLIKEIMTRDDIKTITSIPPILRRSVASVKIKLLNDIKSDPSNVSKHVLLIIFTKMVLAI